MLNKEWGQVWDYGFNANSRVATLAPACYNGKYVYNYRFADEPTASPTATPMASTRVFRSGRCSWASSTSSDPRNCIGRNIETAGATRPFSFWHGGTALKSIAKRGKEQLWK
jgi:hypothetical protein